MQPQPRSLLLAIDFFISFVPGIASFILPSSSSPPPPLFLGKSGVKKYMQFPALAIKAEVFLGAICLGPGGRALKVQPDKFVLGASLVNWRYVSYEKTMQGL